ncbi:hypothetical protein [Mesorhizobium sp. M9A.F.Ca.ET.002.03.1.2]|uniref:hypothetical protein n=1 Tax=Mesorhizobium sp. M9A.F.Ca.ET.002.03.1.2 TaxID=2493668 RepID=UPI001675A37D|nr:hypothetical protein [Mesorhizobium sp. M9A.F.Ca.ET.002.03.1.2]
MTIDPLFPVTTRIYIHADIRLKEKALSQVAGPETHPGRYRPSDELLAAKLGHAA